MSPDPHEHEEHPQREVEPDAPGTWVADPDGDAPEPNEPG